MILSKIFQNNSIINVKLSGLQGMSMLLFVLPTKKILLKIKIVNNIKVVNKNLVILDNRVGYNSYYKLINAVKYYLKSTNLIYYSNFIKLHLVGLGFKNFILNNNLYVLVGDCNYIIFVIPSNLKVYCKKNQIYVLGNSLVDIWNFSSNIIKVKKLNFYKGKGILEFKNFKFMKLKVGKKQRFM